MTFNLLGRALGSVSPQALQQAEASRLLHSLQFAPGIEFDGSDGPPISGSARGSEGGGEEACLAHKAGVNCLTIDPFEGR